MVIESSSSDSYESEEFAIESYEQNSDDDEQNPVTDEIIYPGLILNNEYVLIKKIGYGNSKACFVLHDS
ncbi:MAG: hypothetical protein ABI855_16135, partial [Bacteroidota bacterium]